MHVMESDWERVKSALSSAGVDGSHDFGHFVSDTRYLAPAELDERAAMPVLLEILPTLTDGGTVTAVAGHLRRPWARPAAFDALHLAFLNWAHEDSSAGWALGDSLGSAARREDVPVLLGLAEDESLGAARQMIVFQLGRFKSSPEVAPVLTRLVREPSVALHAMSALRKVIGNEAALPILDSLAADSTVDPTVREHAVRAAKKARKSSAR
jgi:hypothetical protein